MESLGLELYLESLRHMKAIPSYSLLKQRTVSHGHADTPRHGHGSLPRTEAAPTERTRHASGYGCSRAAQWLLYHRLPDPQLSPVAITRQQAGVSELFAGRLGGRLAATNASRPCDEAFAGGDWLSPPATDPCFFQTRARRKLALGAANGVSAGRHSRPEENFGRRTSGGRRVSRGEPSCGSGVSGLPH